VRLLLAAIPIWCTGALLVGSTSWRLTSLVVAIVAITLAAPAYGLVAVALVTPFGALLQPLIGMQLRLAEAIVLAFLAAWLVRPPAQQPGRPPGTASGPRVPPVMTAAAMLLGLAIALSIANTASLLTPFERHYMLDIVLPKTYFRVADWIGAGAGMRLLEGLSIAAATIVLFRQRPRLAVQLPLALTIGAVVCAIGGVWRWWYVLVRVLGLFCCHGFRTSLQTPDLNAGGSYFAMILCLALGMSARARGDRARVAWFGAAAIVAVGLWFTQSRAAMAAATFAVLGAAAWFAGARLQSRRRAMAIAGVLLAVFVALAFRLHQESFGVDYRRQFYAASWRMIRARPFAGVGIGQYYAASALFFPPELASVYGFENAHNNFLQVAGELGVPGLALFVVWLGAALAPGVRALAADRSDARLLGAAAGVGAFAATWLASHPLLVDEVAFPFWIQTGLAVALAESTLANFKLQTATFKPVYVVAAAAAIVVCAAIGRAQGPPAPPDTRDVTGFYDWQTDPDGTRYRWTMQYASLFVPANAVLVSVPLRVPQPPRALQPFNVTLTAEGQHKVRTDLGDRWTVLDIRMPDATPPARAKRLDIHADRTWRPALYVPGSAEMRDVGVEVGEIRIVRGR